jgi:hypothetical protein
MEYYNPFQKREIRFPKRFKDKIEIYCKTNPTGGESLSPDYNPFSRQIDFWMLAVCLGYYSGQKIEDKQSYRFITGEIFLKDPGTIELLEIFGISETGDPYIINKPETIINLANQFAAAGIEQLINMIESSEQAPLWNLTNGFKEFFKDE